METPDFPPDFLDRARAFLRGELRALAAEDEFDEESGARLRLLAKFATELERAEAEIIDAEIRASFDDDERALEAEAE
jgi:hypothetical protein